MKLKKALKKIEKSFEDIDTSKAADGLGDSFKRESAKAETSLDAVADAAQDAAREQAEAFKDAWDEAADSADRASDKIKDDIEDIEDAAEDAGDEIEDKLGEQLEDIVKNFSEGFIGGLVGGIASTISSKAIDAVEEVAEAAIEFGEKALELSSNLEEAQNVADEVFPNMAHRVNAFAESALESAGMSEVAAKQIIGQFGSMALAAELTEKDAADMAITLAQLAGDIASFNNLTQDSAFTKLQSIFTGETEPLRSLGITMSENALLAYALSEGLIDTSKSAGQLREESLALEEAQLRLEKAQKNQEETLDEYGAGTIEAKEAALDLEEASLALAEAQAKLNAQNKPTLDNLSEAEKVMLRYKFVLDRTSKAQGDFARTQSSWANQTRILAGQWEEFQTTIGDGLKDALKPSLEFINNELMPGLQAFAEMFAEAMSPKPIEVLADALIDLDDAIDQTTEKLRNAQAEIDSNATKAEYLLGRIQQLQSEGVEPGTEGFVKLEAAVRALNDIFPDLGLAIDAETGKLNMETQAIDNQITALQNLAEEKAKLAFLEEFQNAMSAAQGAVMDAEYEIFVREGQITDNIKKLAEITGKSEEDIRLMAGSFKDLGDDISAADLATRYFGGALASLNPQTSELFYQIKGNIVEIDKLNNGLDAAKVAVDEANKKYASAERYLESLEAAAMGAADGQNILNKSQTKLTEGYKDSTTATIEYNTTLSGATIKTREEIIEEMTSLLNYMGEYSKDMRNAAGEVADAMTEEWQKMIDKYEELNELIQNGPGGFGNTGGGGSNPGGSNPGGRSPLTPSTYSLVDTSIEPALASVDPYVSDSSNPYAMTASYTIPHSAMAFGEIIPPNAPHTASFPVVSGGNEETIATVRESVEVSMGETGSEVISLLRQMIGTIQGISVGDTVIGEAANRYNRKMNTARGIW